MITIQVITIDSISYHIKIINTDYKNIKPSYGIINEVI